MMPSNYPCHSYLSAKMPGCARKKRVLYQSVCIMICSLKDFNPRSIMWASYCLHVSSAYTTPMSDPQQTFLLALPDEPGLGTTRIMCHEGSIHKCKMISSSFASYPTVPGSTTPRTWWPSPIQSADDAFDTCASRKWHPWEVSYSEMAQGFHIWPGAHGIMQINNVLLYQGKRKTSVLRHILPFWRLPWYIQNLRNVTFSMEEFAIYKGCPILQVCWTNSHTPWG